MSESCPLCQGRGFLVHDVAPGHAEFGRLVPCRCTLAGKRATLFAGALAAMTLESYKPLTAAERTAKQAARSIAAGWLAGATPPGSLVLYAPLQDARREFPGQADPLRVTGCGCGKTHLVVSLAKQALDAGRDVKFTTETDLLRQIKRSYSDEAAPREADLLAELALPWLAVLDDVGTADVKAVGWYQDLLYAIVNERYLSGRPILLTANLDETDLAARLGPRTWSRLREMAVCLKLDGPDRREMKG